MFNTKILSQTAILLAVFTCSQFLSAGFVEDTLDGQSEADAAKAFEDGFAAWIKKRAKRDERKPQIYLSIKKKEYLVQFLEVKEDKYIWEETARRGWYAEEAKYSYKPYWGKTHKIEFEEISPIEIADLFWVKYRSADEVLRLACWLYSKGADDKANSKMAELAVKNEKMRPDIEAWLCEKHGWTLPENGLLLKDTFNFDHMLASVELLTEEAFGSQKKRRTKEAKTIFKKFESKKLVDKVRLETRKIQLAAFEKVYLDLDIVTKKGKKNRKLKDLQEKVDKSLKYIADQLLICERHDLDAEAGITDYETSAKAWTLLVARDLKNPDLLHGAAAAHQKAAVITLGSGGYKSDKQAYATSSADYYEMLTVIHPSYLSFRCSAAYSHAPQGDKGKKRAKKLCYDVIGIVDRLKDPSKNDIGNKKYAESLLKNLR